MLTSYRRVRGRTHCGQSGERLCGSGTSAAGGDSLRSDGLIDEDGVARSHMMRMNKMMTI